MKIKLLLFLGLLVLPSFVSAADNFSAKTIRSIDPKSIPYNQVITLIRNHIIIQAQNNSTNHSYRVFVDNIYSWEVDDKDNIYISASVISDVEKYFRQKGFSVIEVNKQEPGLTEQVIISW